MKRETTQSIEDLTLPPITSMLGGVIRMIDENGHSLECDYMGKKEFANPAGHLQGGMLSSMLDDVTAWLVVVGLEKNARCATLSLNTTFLRPALPGPVLARAKLLRRGRTVCQVEGELWQADKLVATATAVCAIALA